ncbi:MAG: RluA family pseudouridine synthase [Candidatus Omnitrophica bacterium]|nr:RluA family pseudouridine synthase [Candidatus Omnitrophota bacterium]
MVYSFIVTDAHEGLRLDVYLAQVIPDVPSRAFVQKLIAQDRVTVNGKPPVKSNTRVAVGDKVSADVDPASLIVPDIIPQDMAVDVFYEDADIIIINKPSGLTVHPPRLPAGSGTLVNALAHRFQKLSDVNGPVRPGIVHRLDKDTSGLIIVAKTNTAHARLARQFEKHTVVKRYVARLEGKVPFDQGIVDVNIGRHPKYHDQRQASPEGGGKDATTLYQVLRRSSKSTLVALYPRTGRTHQLRVHMKHLGHPILGDDRYGRKAAFPRLALHAQSIAFAHPATKRYVEFSCPAPKEFLDPNF